MDCNSKNIILKKLIVICILIYPFYNLSAQFVYPPKYEKAECFYLTSIPKKWQLDTVRVVTFDDSLATQIMEYLLNSKGDTTHLYRQVFEYDNLSNLLHHNRCFYNVDSARWDLVSEETYLYNDQHKITDVFFLNGSYNHYSYIYDKSTGLITTSYQLNQTFSQPNWDTTYKIEDKYDEKNRLIQLKFWAYDKETGNFTEDSRVDMSYNDLDSISEMIGSRVWGTIIDNYVKIEYKYNSSALLSEERYYSWSESDNEWGKAQIIKYQYDEDGRLYHIIGSNEDPNSSIYRHIVQYEYESYKTTIYDSTQQYNDTSARKSILYYPHKLNVPLADQYTRQILLYPNAAMPGELISAKIDNLNDDEISGMFYSLDGRSYPINFVSKLNNGVIQFTCPDLVSGKYFIVITGGRHIINPCQVLINANIK